MRGVVRQVDATDGEIDALVDELYRLMEAQIAVVGEAS